MSELEKVRILCVHGVRNFNSAGPTAARLAIADKWRRTLDATFDSIAWPYPVRPEIVATYYADHLVGVEEPPAGRFDLFREARERLTQAMELEASPQERVAILTSPEVRAYLADSALREACRAEVAADLALQRPDIVIAHSFGSVIAYEALHACPTVPVRLLVTLGSPLGAEATISEVIVPQMVDGRGRRPASVQRWVNIAAPVDIIAMHPNLAELFDGVDADLHPSIGPAGSHAVERYLTSPVVAGVLAPYLIDRSA